MAKFVEVVGKSTGKKQMVPEHWLDHPTIGAQFKMPPSASKAETSDAKASTKKSSDS